MKYVIDRIEENLAVLEDENCEKIMVDAERIPKEAKEGSTVVFDGEKFCFDPEETAKRRSEIFSRFSKLKNKSCN